MHYVTVSVGQRLGAEQTRGGARWGSHLQALARNLLLSSFRWLARCSSLWLFVVGQRSPFPCRLLLSAPVATHVLLLAFHMSPSVFTTAKAHPVLTQQISLTSPSAFRAYVKISSPPESPSCFKGSCTIWHNAKSQAR